MMTKLEERKKKDSVAVEVQPRQEGRGTRTDEVERRTESLPNFTFRCNQLEEK